MVQGETKNLQRKASSRAQQKKPAPKKGQRSIPPKKAAAIKHVALQKVSLISMQIQAKPWTFSYRYPVSLRQDQ